MIEQSTIQRQKVYGTDATYKRAPDDDAIAAGVVPLDTLPAQWWNWLWEQVTSNDNNVKDTVDSILAELLYCLEHASPAIVPDKSVNGQLWTALTSLVTGDDAMARDGKLGTVKSSDDIDHVSVEADGTMRPNMIGAMAGLDTSAKTSIVQAINELVQGIKDEAKARADKDTELSLSMGDLTALTTATKASLVAAINEVRDNTTFSAYMEGTTLYVAI